MADNANDIKEIQITPESVNAKLKNLGVSATTIGSASVSLAKGDEFTLVDTDKVESNQGEQTNFIPLIFITSNSKSIGVKNFAGLDFEDENAPKFGRTAEEIIKFQMYHTAKGTTFKVRRIDLGDPKPLEGQKDKDGKQRYYIPKNVILEVLD